MVRRAACARIKAVWSCRNDPVDIAGWGHFSAHRQRYRQAAGIQVSNAAMNLDENQKQQVAKWLNDGLKLADVQKKLEQDFALKLTYMEVKFLVSDLNMRPKDPEPEKVVAPPPAAAAGQGTAAEPGLGPDYDDGALEEALPAEPGLPSGGGVKVAVDQIARPGAMISGKVTFPNGKFCEWILDQMGRLGVVPAEDGYKPTAVELRDFQVALQGELRRMGY